eukprot:3500754-Amphidinium_carterae.2
MHVASACELHGQDPKGKCAPRPTWCGMHVCQPNAMMPPKAGACKKVGEQSRVSPKSSSKTAGVSNFHSNLQQIMNMTRAAGDSQPGHTAALESVNRANEGGQ